MLKINQVVKSFGGTIALRGINLEVQRGEFHALLGENGAGKSTLVKLVSGVYTPDSGQILWENVPVTTFSPLHTRSLGIGVVHQDSALISDLSVEANFSLGREPVNPLGWVRWDNVRHALSQQAERFHVNLKPDLLVRDLKVGQRKFLDIMRVLKEATNLVILDEPTAAFTVQDTHNLMDILWQIKKSGIAIVYVTHRLSDIENIVDRVTVLKDGLSAGTLNPKEATPERIISMMVGRELGDIYPPAPTANHEPVLLEIQNGSCHNAFSNVDIKVRSGEIVALVGLSGHGAFEVAHSICGDPAIETGMILVDGQAVINHTPRHALQNAIGLVTEDRAENVLKVLSVKDNLSLAALKKWSFLGWIKNFLQSRRVQELIQMLNIKTKGVHASADSLSGGNQQKLVLGRWLAVDTRVLVLVDPTAGVDVGARLEIYKLLRKVAAQGNAILIATSDLAEAIGLSDRLYAFYKGRVQAEFSRAEADEAAILSVITGYAHDGELVDAGVSPTPKPVAITLDSEGNSTEIADEDHERRSRWSLSRSNAPILLMAFILTLALIFVPNFSNLGNLRNVMVQSVPLLLTAVGQTLVIITAGIDLSIGEMVTLSTILATSVMTLEHVGIAGALVTCLLAGALVGSANAFMVNQLNLPPFLATLATMFFLQGVNLYLRPVPGGSVSPAFRELAKFQLGQVPLTPLIVVLVIGIFAYHFSRSRFGLQLYSVGGDENRARLSGVANRRLKLIVYVTASMIASLAGMFLAARTGSGDARVGGTYVFDSITATVLGGSSLAGGAGTIWGALASGFVLAMLSNILNLLGVITYWQWIIRGAILVSAVAIYSLIDMKAADPVELFRKWIRILRDRARRQV